MKKMMKMMKMMENEEKSKEINRRARLNCGCRRQPLRVCVHIRRSDCSCALIPIAHPGDQHKRKTGNLPLRAPPLALRSGKAMKKCRK